jgi:hypothetical protein
MDLWMLFCQLLLLLQRLEFNMAFTPPIFVRSVIRKETSSSTDASPTVKEAANELLSLMIDRRRKNAGGSDDKLKRIDLLVDVLQEGQVSFDPEECLNGPLFIVSYRRGPPPLWEKLGLMRQDVQGQQYRYGNREKSVINYAEIFGRSLHIRAYGSYRRDDESDFREHSDEAAPKSPLFFLDNSKKGLLKCPVDFIVSVTKGTVNIFDNELNIPIAGTGYLRVLYADPRLRVFVSPKDTTDDRWEKEGLVVVQVRSDLVDGLIEL